MLASAGAVTPPTPLGRSAVSLIGRAVNGVLAKAGYRIFRIRPPEAPMDLRDVTDDPIEAIYLSKGKPFLIEVPLARCRGLGYLAFPCVPGAGHPFIDSIEVCLNGNQTTFRGSPLERFCQHWRPRSAAEAMGILDRNTSRALLEAPPYGVVLPWAGITPDDAARYRIARVKEENMSFGVDFGIQEGFLECSPLSPRKLELEYIRLKNVTESIKEHGFKCDPVEHGYISGYLLIDRGEFAVSIRPGQHRIAALAALGYSSAPVVIGLPSNHWPYFATYRNDVRSWPNVRNGLFTINQALELFDRLLEGKQPSGCPTGTW